MYYGTFDDRSIVRLLIKHTGHAQSIKWPRTPSRPNPFRYNHSDNKCVFLYIVLDFGNTCRGTNPRAMRVKVPHRLSYNQHFLRPRETQHGREFADVENKT